MAYLGEKIKKLGFGLMRLPQKDGAIDLEETKAMVDKFMEAGFTYFDTAWAYQGSEEATRKALVERYPRENFQLATKNAAWLNTKSREEAEAQFQTSLDRTGAGYFDFYLLHNLGQGRTHVFEDYDLWNFALEKKRQGLIKHLGFSFHSNAQELEEILNAHPEAEFVQLQINYADWESADIQSRACYEVARRHGKPVIIMEPVKGGTLANPPQRVKDIFQKADPSASCASWAVKFAASLDGIITVLSGMSNLEQMEDNLSCMKDFKGLTPREEEVILAARKELESIPMIPCTGCDYCAKVCPRNVGISGTFTAMNLLLVYENLPAAKRKENARVAENGKANAAQCIQCGQCEQVCPQHIAIREELKRAAKSLL